MYAGAIHFIIVCFNNLLYLRWHSLSCIRFPELLSTPPHAISKSWIKICTTFQQILHYVHVTPSRSHLEIRLLITLICWWFNKRIASLCYQDLHNVQVAMLACYIERSLSEYIFRVDHMRRMLSVTIKPIASWCHWFWVRCVKDLQYWFFILMSSSLGTLEKLSDLAEVSYLLDFCRARRHLGFFLLLKRRFDMRLPIILLTKPLIEFWFL